MRLDLTAVEERFERVLSIISPGWALERARLRSALNVYDTHASRAFEGAAKGRRTKNWRATDPGPAGPAEGSLAELRRRSRDLERNNGWAKNGISGIATTMVGPGIVCQPRVYARSTKRKSKEIAQLWKTWAMGVECDFDGLQTFYGLQQTVTKSMVDSGEVLVRRRLRRVSDTEVALELQVLEADFLDTSKDLVKKDGTRIIQGVEFDSRGKRVAYYIFTEHPANRGSVVGFRGYESKRVLAEDIIHLFRLERPGQVRGIPWLAPAILNLRDLDEYEDAELVRRKIATCFTAFVTSPLPEDEDTSDPDDLREKMEPGTIEHLPPGKTVTLATPPTVTGYKEYSSAMLHKVAAALQCPYTVLTGDFSEVNFSSGRLGWLQFWKHVDQWRWNILIPRFCDRVFNWYLEALALSGVKTEGVTPEWTPPKRDMIDPQKEIAATKEAIKAGIKSLPEAIREEGYEPEDLLDEIEDFQKKADAKGLKFDTDMRQQNKVATV